MHVQEITNELYLKCIRTATEIVEALELKDVNSSIMHFTEEEKRAVLSQKLAGEMFKNFTDKNSVDG